MLYLRRVRLVRIRHILKHFYIVFHLAVDQTRSCAFPHSCFVFYTNIYHTLEAWGEELYYNFRYENVCARSTKVNTA